MSTTRTLAALALATGLALSGCSKSTSSVSEGRTPEEVMTLSKKTLDETSGVQLDLSTDDLPDGVTGVSKASGIVTHAPAFEGTITVKTGLGTFEIPVIGVDGKTYADTPLSNGYTVVDPGEYGAPVPGLLIDPDTGVSNLLTATENVEKGDEVRGGKDNKEILTEYTGTVPAANVEALIPSATGDDFEATYTIASNGELREVVLTGQFYEGAEDNTYVVDFTDYGTDKDIAAP